MLYKEPDRAWEFIDEHLPYVCDNNDIPLSAWTRATANLIPKPDSEDPAIEYVIFYRGIIERSPIIHKYLIGKATNALEEDRQAWTDNFKAREPYRMGEALQDSGGDRCVGTFQRNLETSKWSQGLVQHFNFPLWVEHHFLLV